MKPLMILLLLLPCSVRADDTVLVHDLAHLGAGVLVASYVDVAFPKVQHKWIKPMVMLLVTAGADDVYEAITRKDPITRLEHDSCAVAGAELLCLQIHF